MFNKELLTYYTNAYAAIGRSPAPRRAATSKHPTTCTLPSDVISHNLIHHQPDGRLTNIMLSLPNVGVGGMHVQLERREDCEYVEEHIFVTLMTHIVAYYENNNGVMAARVIL